MVKIEIDRDTLLSLIKNYDELVAGIEPELRDGIEDYLSHDIDQIRGLVRS